MREQWLGLLLEIKNRLSRGLNSLATKMDSAQLGQLRAEDGFRPTAASGSLGSQVPYVVQMMRDDKHSG